MLRNKILTFLKNRYAPRGAYLSFAYSGEDILIRRACEKFHLKNPTYLEIGTHHPIFGNNTYLLYRSGSKGMLVEPNPQLFKTIEQKRPQDISILGGVSDHDGTAEFYKFKRDTRSTFSKEQADAWTRQSGEIASTEEVKIFSLNTLTRDFTPDILCIDAEGLDYKILHAYNWHKKPKILCIEMDEGIEKLVSEKGYSLFAQTEANGIFILCVE